MNLVERLDKWIFYVMCIFALTTAINHVLANNILVVGVILGGIRWYKKRPEFYMLKEYRRSLGVFFIVIFITIFFSPDVLESTKEFWRYFNRMFPFFLVLFFIKEKKQLLAIFFAFLLSMTIDNLYAVYKTAILLYNGVTSLRITGFEIGAIIFAGYLLILLPIIFILIYSRKLKGSGWIKYILFAFAIAFFALLGNGTRIAWLIIAIILPLIFIMKVRDIKMIFITGCIGIFLCMLAFYTMPFLQSRLYSITDFNQRSNQGHYLIVRDSLELVKDYSIKGVGLGRYQEVFKERYQSEEYLKLGYGAPPHAHNNTLTIWAETGIFGCIAFWYMYLSFLYYSFRRWLKEKNDSDLMFFMITLATVLQGITDYSFGLNQVVKIYFCMLAIYLNYQIYEKQVERIK